MNGVIRSSLALPLVFSLFAGSAQAHSKPKPRVERTGPVRIRGFVTGFGSLPKDDQIEGAIVLPSLTAGEILSLRATEYLSPNEQVSVGAFKIGVPGNVFLPSQSENIGAVPVKFEKASFSYDATPGRSYELSALSFQGRFSKLLQLARNKAPLTSLFAHLRTRTLAYAPNQDWSVRDGESIELSLDELPNKRLSYNWYRPVGPLTTQDLIINLQQTRSGRWLLTDIIGEAPLGGSLNTYNLLGADTKSLFVRLYQDKKNALPVAATGFVFQSRSRELLSAKGLIPRLTGTRLESNKVIWDPIRNRQGWIAIIAGSGTSQSSVLAWVSPEVGQFELPPNTTKPLSLLFIGTDRAVAKPDSGTLVGDPSLFIYAQEFRFARLK